MSLNLFSGSTWTITELRSLLKKLEGMYAGGVRQSTFKDQTLIFGSTSELKERINALREEICRRDEESGEAAAGSGSRKKVVKVTSRNRGFGPTNRRGKFC
jgi:uncharacterized small protein (DUF1192 family)